VPKPPKYIIPRGYNTVGRVPQTTEEFLDLLVLPLPFSFPLPGTTLENTLQDHPNSYSSAAMIPITKFSLEELALQESLFIQTHSSLARPLCYYFFYPNLQLIIRDKSSSETALICKPAPAASTIYPRAVWFASDGSCTQHSPPQSKGRKKINKLLNQGI